MHELSVQSTRGGLKKKEFKILSHSVFDSKVKNKDKLIKKRIEELERFLTNIARRYEFWTQQVLSFI